MPDQLPRAGEILRSDLALPGCVPLGRPPRRVPGSELGRQCPGTHMPGQWHAAAPHTQIVLLGGLRRPAAHLSPTTPRPLSAFGLLTLWSAALRCAVPLPCNALCPAPSCCAVQRTVGELKRAACAHVGVSEHDYELFDYWQGERGKSLEGQYGDSLQDAEIVLDQQLALVPKVGAVLWWWWEGGGQGQGGRTGGAGEGAVRGWRGLSIDRAKPCAVSNSRVPAAQ